MPVRGVVALRAEIVVGAFLAMVAECCRTLSAHIAVVVREGEGFGQGLGQGLFGLAFDLAVGWEDFRARLFRIEMDSLLDFFLTLR